MSPPNDYVYCDEMQIVFDDKPECVGLPVESLAGKGGQAVLF
jgi:hypothetical protein